MTGAEDGFHVWDYLLSETNPLDKNYLIAEIRRFTGTLITVAAAVGAFVRARQGEKPVSEIGLQNLTLLHRNDDKDVGKVEFSQLPVL